MHIFLIDNNNKIKEKVQSVEETEEARERKK